MRDVYTEVKTRQQPIESASALAPIPAADLAWRRRAIRLCWFLTFVGGIGLSMIPGPKGSSSTLTISKEGTHGVQIRTFSYYRPYGVPFQVARAHLDDFGTMKDFTVKGDSGIFGNFAVAFVISFGLLALWGRRRREG